MLESSTHVAAPLASRRRIARCRVVVAYLVALLSVLAGGCAGRDRALRSGRPWQAAEVRPAGPRAADSLDDAIPHAPGLYFRAEAFHEDALAGPHEHAVVELVDIPVLVIRDADVFRTPPDRADAIARALQEALHVGDRFFVVGDDAGHPTIYSVSHHGGYPRRVLRVTRGDAIAYARRSGRAVDPHLLAEWWLAMLRDVFAVVLNHVHALSIYFMHCNFVRIHQTLRCTPAMEAKVTDRLWSLDDVAALVKAREESASDVTQKGWEARRRAGDSRRR